jgi:hypothetical protein
MMKLAICTAMLFSIPIINLQEIDDDLPINKIQVIGSHNSYKKAIDPLLFSMFAKGDSVSASKIDYEHIPVIEQLNLGLRNLEIDVYADAKGGKYAHPRGLDLVKGQSGYDEHKEMMEPGFKVFHIQELDFRSDFLTFRSGLKQLRKWSEANPTHTPIFITLEPKDGRMRDSTLTVPEPFTEKTYEELDREITNTLGKEHLLTPDEVRGHFSTLEEAVLHGNWPVLKAARGKFVFILDQKGDKMELYIKGHSSLKNRVLFTNTPAGRPEAAIMIINDAKNKDIPALIKKGYMIRTRADSDTQEARRNDYSSFEAACASGAQIITTDYYQKSTHFKSDYIISFEGKKYFRANPFFEKIN